MAKPTKNDLGHSRYSDLAIKTFEAAFKSADPQKALGQLAGLLGQKVVLCCRAVKYSSSNGEPIEFEWVPNEEWKGDLWLNWGLCPPSISLDNDSPLYDPLLNYLPIGKTKVLKVGNRQFVVKHLPDRSEGSWERGGTVPHHIEFTVAD